MERGARSCFVSVCIAVGMDGRPSSLTAFSGLTCLLNVYVYLI